MNLFSKCTPVAALATLFLMTSPASAGVLVSTVSVVNAPVTASLQVFSDNEVNVQVCNFCVFTDFTPWDIFITDPSGNGIIIDHIYGEEDNLDFSTGAPGGGDASIGTVCSFNCQEQGPGGFTDVTALYNSLGVSDVGGAQSMTVDDVVPEPGTVALLGLGLAGLCMLRRRQTVGAR
jgi:PEP-CTERM motif